MDIDIDLRDRTELLSILPHRIATLSNGNLHNSGIYVTEIPHNPLSMQSTLNYKEAEDRGYFKFDILNVSIYQQVKNEEHLLQLMHKEPKWELLQEENFVNQLFHLNGHGKVLKKLCPTSVAQLAATLSIIRPAKKYLIEKSWKVIMNEVWEKPNNNEYYFKKAHAFSYAMLVIVHMNLLCEQQNL